MRRLRHKLAKALCAIAQWIEPNMDNPCLTDERWQIFLEGGEIYPVRITETLMLNNRKVGQAITEGTLEGLEAHGIISGEQS